MEEKFETFPDEEFKESRVSSYGTSVLLILLDGDFAGFGIPIGLGAGPPDPFFLRVLYPEVGGPAIVLLRCRFWFPFGILVNARSLALSSVGLGGGL